MASPSSIVGAVSAASDPRQMTVSLSSTCPWTDRLPTLHHALTPSLPVLLLRDNAEDDLIESNQNG